jgi:hypothetical protein
MTKGVKYFPYCNLIRKFQIEVRTRSYYVRIESSNSCICLGGAQPSAELLANLTSSCEPATKVPRLGESQTNNNLSPVSFDAPKRTRFTFRPEHLDVKLLNLIFKKKE